MKNVTISLTESVMKEVRLMAARQSKSISRFISDTLESLIDNKRARKASLEAYLSRGTYFNSGGKKVSRSEIYDRKVLR